MLGSRSTQQVRRVRVMCCDRWMPCRALRGAEGNAWPRQTCSSRRPISPRKWPSAPRGALQTMARSEQVLRWCRYARPVANGRSRRRERFASRRAATVPMQSICPRWPARSTSREGLLEERGAGLLRLISPKGREQHRMLQPGKAPAVAVCSAAFALNPKRKTEHDAVGAL